VKWASDGGVLKWVEKMEEMDGIGETNEFVVFCEIYAMLVIMLIM